MNHLRATEEVSEDSLCCVNVFWHMTGIIFHGIIILEGKACVKMEQWDNVYVYNMDQNTVQLSPMKG